MLSIDSLLLHRGGKAVLHGISLRIPPGEVTALLGANGAGKSSTVMAIAGTLPVSGGRIEVEGQTLHNQRPEDVRALSVAVVPEGHRVLGELSVLDNLRAAATLLPQAEVPAGIDRVLAIFPELEPKLALGLSPMIVKRLAEVVQQVAREGVGVLLIEQFTTLALGVSSRAYVLERGRMAFEGTSEELRQRPEILHSSYLAGG
jgi:branched-chain amino acid transport system ATP-binding protein